MRPTVERSSRHHVLPKSLNVHFTEWPDNTTKYKICKHFNLFNTQTPHRFIIQLNDGLPPSSPHPGSRFFHYQRCDINNFPLIYYISPQRVQIQIFLASVFSLPILSVAVKVISCRTPGHTFEYRRAVTLVPEPRAAL